jgi:hypothetical protein
MIPLLMLERHTMARRRRRLACNQIVARGNDAPAVIGYGGAAMMRCYLWEDIEISNIEEGRALNSWLIGL